jgi:hypothetical protein
MLDECPQCSRPISIVDLLCPTCTAEALSGPMLDQDGNTCWHEFKQYVGFRETYEYCVKCDEKRK